MFFLLGTRFRTMIAQENNFMCVTWGSWDKVMLCVCVCVFLGDLCPAVEPMGFSSVSYLSPVLRSFLGGPLWPRPSWGRALSSAPGLRAFLPVGSPTHRVLGGGGRRILFHGWEVPHLGKIPSWMSVSEGLRGDLNVTRWDAGPLRAGPLFRSLS